MRIEVCAFGIARRRLSEDGDADVDLDLAEVLAYVK